MVYGFQIWAGTLLGNAVYDALVLFYDPTNAIGQYFYDYSYIIFTNPLVSFGSILASLYLFADSDLLAFFMIPSVAQLVASSSFAYYLVVSSE